MPQLTRIARSTVLRMQICFAWKSIWSCSKESRTALLLSPPRPAHAGLPLAVYLLSRGNHFHQLRTHRPTVSGTALPRQAQSTMGQYADLTGPHWRAPVCERDKEPCNCLLSRITRAIRGHGGNNYALGEEPRPPILSVCSIRWAVQLSVCDLGISKIINRTFWVFLKKAYLKVVDLQF